MSVLKLGHRSRVALSSIELDDGKITRAFSCFPSSPLGFDSESLPDVGGEACIE